MLVRCVSLEAEVRDGPATAAGSRVGAVGGAEWARDEPTAGYESDGDLRGSAAGAVGGAEWTRDGATAGYVPDDEARGGPAAGEGGGAE